MIKIPYYFLPCNVLLPSLYFRAYSHFLYILYFIFYTYSIMYDLLIVGSGAAGLASGLYAGRYKLKTVIVLGDFGGATATAGIIANYPGVKSIDGYELMTIMKEQAACVGTEFKEGFVSKIERDGHCFTSHIGKEKINSKAIIFAAGAEHRKLGLANEENLTGRGVHYCVTCDGPVYTDKTIAIVGGGDASVKAANLASEYVKKIYFFTREKAIHAEPVNYERMKKHGDKIEIFLETELKEIVGEKKLKKLILTKPINSGVELVVDGLFIEIGAAPATKIPKSLGVILDEHGYIKVDEMMKTNVDGFFAAGDVISHFGRFKQDITASATGTVAATSAYEDNKVHGDLCDLHKLPQK